LRASLNYYYAFFGKDTPINEITYLKHIVPFISSLRCQVSKQTTKKLTEATYNRLCGYLRSIFRFALFAELIEKNPMQRWRKTKEFHVGLPLT